MLNDTRPIVRTKEAFLALTKLHEIMEWALHDFDLAAANPKYRIAMNTWYQEQPQDHPCLVCFAGAVIAYTLSPEWYRNAPWFAPGVVTGYTPGVSHMLALNSLRRGLVADAWIAMHGYDSLESPDHRTARALNRGVVSYADSPSIWRRQMDKLQRDLREADL